MLKRAFSKQKKVQPEVTRSVNMGILHSHPETVLKCKCKMFLGFVDKVKGLTVKLWSMLHSLERMAPHPWLVENILFPEHLPTTRQSPGAAVRWRFYKLFWMIKCCKPWESHPSHVQHLKHRSTKRLCLNTIKEEANHQLQSTNKFVYVIHLIQIDNFHVTLTFYWPERLACAVTELSVHY